MGLKAEATSVSYHSIAVYPIGNYRAIYLVRIMLYIDCVGSVRAAQNVGIEGGATHAVHIPKLDEHSRSLLGGVPLEGGSVQAFEVPGVVETTARRNCRRQRSNAEARQMDSSCVEMKDR